MSSFKKLSKADVTVVPYNANKQWNLSFDCFPTSSDYLTIYKGTNVPGTFSLSDPINNGQYERLIYSEINHMFYQAYSGSLNTGSLMFNINTYQSASQQRPTASYFDYNNNNNLISYFPTGSNEGIRVVAINQGIYGNKVLPNYFILSSSAYYITDDGYGNLYDSIVTGSQQSTNEAYASDGVKLYSSGYNIDGTGTNISWNTSTSGGSYVGTFWTNPITANKTGRLNYNGLWSGKSTYYLGTGTLTFNITASSNSTYYFGIGCDNLASLYLDNTLIIAQSYPDGTGANFKYWHIYPVNVSSGSHVVKLVGENAGIPGPNNPGSMGIEIYNNTSTQISASITTSPSGPSIPSGINLIYSSKDHLTEGNFGNQYGTHIGNLFYSHGLGIITNQDYQLMFPLSSASCFPITTTTTSTTTSTTTAAPTTTSTTTSTTSASPPTENLPLYYSAVLCGVSKNWQQETPSEIKCDWLEVFNAGNPSYQGTLFKYYTSAGINVGTQLYSYSSPYLPIINNAGNYIYYTGGSTPITDAKIITVSYYGIITAIYNLSDLPTCGQYVCPTTTTTTSTTTSTTTVPTTTSTTTSTTTIPTTTTSTTTSTTTVPTTTTTTSTTSTTTSTTTEPTTTSTTTSTTTATSCTFWNVFASSSDTPTDDNLLYVNYYNCSNTLTQTTFGLNNSNSLICVFSGTTPSYYVLISGAQSLPTNSTVTNTLTSCS